MSDRTIQVPHPPHLPADHLQDPRLSILDASGDAVLSYCRQTHTGSVWPQGLTHPPRHRLRLRIVGQARAFVEDAKGFA